MDDQGNDKSIPMKRFERDVSTLTLSILKSSSWLIGK